MGGKATGLGIEEVSLYGLLEGDHAVNSFLRTGVIIIETDEDN